MERPAASVSQDRLLPRRIRARVRVPSVRVAAVTALLLASLVGVGSGVVSVPTQTGAGPDIRALTGAHTRAVWVQGDGTDPFAAGTRLTLMGFDSDDGRSERAIVGQVGSYMKPLLTARGERVVFSTRSAAGADSEVMIVAWNGSNARRLTKGFALAVWQDPADGREWAYIGLDRQRDTFRAVRRVRVDDPGASELVWNKTAVSADSFQVSTDGRLAGGLFPWPEAGVAELPNRSWRKLGEGCWTDLTDVGTPLFWYFDGAHRNLTMVDLEAGSRWTVGIAGAPGFANAEAYHPRWTNHPRFLAVTGPYNQGGQNQVRRGGAQAEVWVGRFADDYSRVEAWSRVTRNSGGDAYPDVWIDRRRSGYQARSPGPLGPAPATAPAAGGAVSGFGVGRLTVSARLVAPGVIPSPRAIAPYRHALVASVYDVVRVTGGSYSERRVLVAHWAIRDGQVIAGARRIAGTTYELTLEPYDAHLELEGERLIMGEAVSGLRLFYDVGSAQREERPPS